MEKNCSNLLNQIVKHCVREVAGGHAVVAVNNGQLGGVFKRMLVKTEEKERTAQSPDIRGRVDGEVCPHVQHFRCPVHWCCMSCHFVLKGCALTHRPFCSRLVCSGKIVKMRLNKELKSNSEKQATN